MLETLMRPTECPAHRMWSINNSSLKKKIKKKNNTTTVVFLDIVLFQLKAGK